MQPKLKKKFQNWFKKFLISGKEKSVKIGVFCSKPMQNAKVIDKIS